MKVFILLLVFFGITSALSFIPILVEDALSAADRVIINQVFNILVIPIYLAIITQIVYLKMNFNLNKGLLFFLSAIAILNSVNIIQERYGNLWEIVSGIDKISQVIYFTIICLAITVYFLLYFIIIKISF